MGGTNNKEILSFEAENGWGRANKFFSVILFIIIIVGFIFLLVYLLSHYLYATVFMCVLIFMAIIVNSRFFVVFGHEDENDSDNTIYISKDDWQRKGRIRSIILLFISLTGMSFLFFILFYFKMPPTMCSAMLIPLFVLLFLISISMKVKAIRGRDRGKRIRKNRVFFLHMLYVIFSYYVSNRGSYFAIAYSLYGVLLILGIMMIVGGGMGIWMGLFLILFAQFLIFILVRKYKGEENKSKGS